MLLYIGNFLERHGKTPNFNRFLIEKFQEHFEVKFASEEKNELLRLLDMHMKLLQTHKKVEVVLIDTFSTRAFWFAYTTARTCQLLGIPYLTVLGGGNLPHRLEQSPKACEQLFRNSATNVSPSIYLEDIFRTKGYKVDYIPNFIDLENYVYKKREVYRPRLLWVRSFHKIYNPTMAVDILKKLREKHADAVLCMVGPDKDGSLNLVQERANELGVSDSLTITGRLDKKDWIKLAADYDIFINTTDFDNHPVSVIEAMGLGLPLVSTDVGGMPYLIANGKDGILVPPHNPDAFVDAIEDLLQDPAKATRLAKEARRKVEGFEWNNLREQWLSLLNSAMQPTA